MLVVEAGYDANGKRIKRTKTVKGISKREAQKELAKFQTEVEAGEYIAPEKMRFVKFVEEWQEKYGLKHLEPKTLETYAHILRNHILPVFGHLKLNDVMPIHVLSFLKSLENDGSRKDGKPGGLSSASIRFIHRILKDVFERAVDWRIIKNNPVGAVKRPKVSQKAVEVYDEHEVVRLFEALEKEPIHWRIIITLALTTGLRRGELLALEWKHIDLEKCTINVDQALSYVNGQSIIKEPKTKSSKRMVSIPESLIPDLKEYSLQSRKNRLAAGDEWEGGERFFIFSAWNGKPYYHTVPGTWLRRFIK